MMGQFFRLAVFLVSAAVAQAQNTMVKITTDTGGVGGTVWRLQESVVDGEVKESRTRIELRSADDPSQVLRAIPPSATVLVNLGDNELKVLQLVTTDARGNEDHGPKQNAIADRETWNEIKLPSAAGGRATSAGDSRQGMVSQSSGGGSIPTTSTSSLSPALVFLLVVMLGGVLVLAVKIIIGIRDDGGRPPPPTTVREWPADLRLRQPHLVPHRKLSTGGMGTVFVVRNHRPGFTASRDKLTVVKVLHAQFAETECPEAVRFLDEARVLTLLAPTGLAPRLHQATAERPGSGAALWYEMEFLDGWNTLRHHIGGRERRRISWPDASRWISALSQAVVRLHAAGVVHRDLSPENVMVNGDPAHLRLIDFGLAKWEGRSYRDDRLRSEHLTQPGEHVGKPKYCAPEQWRDGLAAATEAADWYAVGVIAFEAIMGLPPHDSVDEALRQGHKATLARISKQLEECCPPPNSAEAGVHVEHIVGWLHPDPRYRRIGA